MYMYTHVSQCESLLNVSLSNFPMYRTGCKPLVEVYQDGERIYASATHDNMESIRSFHSEDGCVEIPMEARIRGNLLVVIHHIRAIPVAKKAGIVRIPI